MNFIIIKQKELISEIKALKKIYRSPDFQKTGSYKTIQDLYKNKYEYRHRHIAYCLLRGTSYEKIEKPAENNKPNMKYVKELIEIFTNKLNELGYYKLYVLVRNDLEKSQKTVQSIHAASEYLLHNKDNCWNNGTVVVLKVNDENELKVYENKIKDMKLEYKTFQEPDLNNQKTALSFVSKHKVFLDLPLL